MEFTYSFPTASAHTSYAISPDAPQLVMTFKKDAHTTSLYIDDIHRGLAYREEFFVVCGPGGNYSAGYTDPVVNLISCPFSWSVYK